jgi:hypothetical protein
LARYKVINLISAGVSITDLGIHLSGKGSYKIIDSSAKNGSYDIKDAEKRRLVKIERIIEEKVPIWPFFKESRNKSKIQPKIKSESEVQSTSSLDELTRAVKSIEKSLIELLQRPSPPPPEIIAAHMKSINQIGEIPRGLPGAPPRPGPGASENPLYIPSKIRPEVKDGEVSISSKDMSTDDVDQSVDMLRQMRRNRKK